MAKNYVQQWTVQSKSSSSRFYKVSVTDQGEWECDCPAWKFRSPRVDCKHITEIKGRVPESESRELPKCDHCGRVMAEGEGCSINYVYIDGIIYHRATNPHDGCDCGTQQGKYHHFGCDMEPCPKCGGQFFVCDCGPEFFGTLAGLQEKFPDAEVRETAHLDIW